MKYLIPEKVNVEADNNAIEDFTDSTLKMAAATITTLNDYSEVLEVLSIKASEFVGLSEFQGRFLKLIEGIETFADSIEQVKSLLNIGTRGTVEILESDLTSILKDLLDSQEKGNSVYAKTLLKTHLPANLVLWRTTGLPSLQHTKDC